MKKILICLLLSLLIVCHVQAQSDLSVRKLLIKGRNSGIDARGGVPMWWDGFIYGQYSGNVQDCIYFDYTGTGQNVLNLEKDGSGIFTVDESGNVVAAGTITGIGTQGHVATVVVAAFNSKDKEKADYVCDGTDDQVEIQAAINALPGTDFSNTINGTVQLLDGTYVINGITYIKRRHTTIRGMGASTLITRSATPFEGIIFATQESYITLENMHFWGGAPYRGSSNSHMISIGATYGKLQNLQLLDQRGTGAILATAAANKLTVNDVSVTNIYKTGGDTSNNSIILDGCSDVSISNFMVVNSGGISIQSNSARVNLNNLNMLIYAESITNSHGGIYVLTGSTDILINNAQIRRNGFPAHGGMELRGQRISVIGVDISGFGDGIEIWSTDAGGDVRDIVITNSHLHDNSYYGISIMTAGGTNIQRVIVKGNFILNNVTAGVYLGTTHDRVIIEGNQFYNNGSAFGGNAVAGDMIRNNQGYTTENSGTATVTSGNTYADVTHSLAITPSINDITVVAANNLGDADKFWISDVGASTFRINVNADPGATTATFVWQVGSY